MKKACQLNGRPFEANRLRGYSGSCACFCFFLSGNSCKLLVQRLNRYDPRTDNQEQDCSDIRSDRADGSEKNQESLLDKRSARFTKSCAHDVDRGFTFNFRVRIKRDVSHLFRWVEERVFRGLTHDVLGSSEEDSQHQWGSSEHNQEGRKVVAEQDEGKEAYAGDQQYDRGNHSGKAPALSSH